MKSQSLKLFLLRQTRKTASYLKPQAIENSFKRAYGEVEDNIIIYIERLRDLRSNESRDHYHEDGDLVPNLLGVVFVSKQLFSFEV